MRGRTDRERIDINPGCGRSEGADINPRGEGLLTELRYGAEFMRD
jgi:hypothetical protein